MENHTFVIPAYQDSPYIEECIISLKNQTKGSNIIIITSTPSDHIQNIAKKFSVEVVVNNTLNKGIAGDWNFALSQAETRFVTIAHQDDIYESNYLEAVLFKLNRKKTLIAFTDYCEYVEGKIRDRSLNLKVKKFLLFPFIIKSEIKCKFFKRLPLLFGNPVCCPSVTFNKEELQDFAFSSEYAYNLDWNAWLELAKRDGAFVFINKKLMKHRIHHGSETTKQLKTDVRKKEELKMFEIIWGKNIARFLAWLYTRGHKDNIL